MKTTGKILLGIFVLLLMFFALKSVNAQQKDYPDPVKNPESPLMLSGEWVPDNSANIDFFNLPRVPSLHIVISNVSAKGITDYIVDKTYGGVNQHNYLTFFGGLYWIMWSDGPGVEDRVGQVVKYATSTDGISWSEPKFLMPYPPHSSPESPYYNQRNKEGYRFISRGFWVRNYELYALASFDEAAGLFGKSLELRAFKWDKVSEKWIDVGVIYKNAINNFPPKQISTGEWLMSRRTNKLDEGNAGISFLVGGTRSISEWESFRVRGSDTLFKADEPFWWILPDGKNIMSVYRDNSYSGFLYRAFSTDNGRTWSKPVKTNFPDTASKIHGTRLSDGRYVLVSNARPQRPRDPLVLSISDDGVVFNKMGYLIGGRWVDYPFVMEHDGYLYVAFSGAKQTVELLKIDLTDLDKIDMSKMLRN